MGWGAGQGAELLPTSMVISPYSETSTILLSLPGILNHIWEEGIIGTEQELRERMKDVSGGLQK